MNGGATTINSTNLDISDNLIVLNKNLTVENPNDSGILINRGPLDLSNNAFIGWDESNDSFLLGTTEADGESIGNLSITPGKLILKDLSATDISAVNISTTDIIAKDISATDISAIYIIQII